MKPIERVRDLILYKKISISAFEKAAGMSNNSIQAAIKRNANLKDDTLNNILKAFPEVSAMWLLTGKGEMLAASGEHLLEPHAAYHTSDQYIIELQKEYIEQLKEEIKRLKAAIAEV